MHGQAAIISGGSDNILERSDDGPFCELLMPQMPCCSAARAAGPKLMAERRKLGSPAEEARLSSVCRLPAPHVDHKGWPDVLERGRRGAIISRNSYRSCIGIARSQGFCDIAFAGIATVPASSALIETFAIHLLLATLALAQVPAAFLLAAPETDPVIRRTAVRFGLPALLTILIEIDDHRCLPPLFREPLSASQPR